MITESKEMYSKKVSGHAFSSNKYFYSCSQKISCNMGVGNNTEGIKKPIPFIATTRESIFFSLKDIDTRWHVHFVVSNYRSQKLHHKEI